MLHNPHARRPPIDDFADLVDLSVEAGEVLTARALAALQPLKPRAYGKAVLVGMAGDLEHGASMIHVRLGSPCGGAPAVNQRSFPADRHHLGGLEDAWDYDAMDSMTVSIADAPRPGEILLAIAFLRGTRPNARITGASPGQVEELVRSLRRERS